MGGDGKILSKVNLGSKSEDLSYYLNTQGKSDDISVAIEASYNWLYYYRILEDITDNIVVAHPLKTRIIGEARVKTDKIDLRSAGLYVKSLIYFPKYIYRQEMPWKTKCFLGQEYLLSG